MPIIHSDEDEPAVPALPIRAAPFGRALERSSMMMLALVAAAAVLALVGCFFYGPRVLLLVGTGGVFAVLTEAAARWLSGRAGHAGMVHSLAMGMIVALMLPVTAPWYMAAAGAAVAVWVGKWLMGGLGHYPWNPAAIAVVALYFLWPEYVTPNRWPLLSADNVLVGNDFQAGPFVEGPVPQEWANTSVPSQAIGFSLVRADMVLQAVNTPVNAAGHVSLVSAVRDRLPSWWDMLIGATAGPIGMGSTLALLFVGFALVWRGYLRWVLPVSVLCGVFGAAVILPVTDIGWFPVRYSLDNMPLGMIWVAYHVLLGPTLFAAVMLAGETVTSPMAQRGQIVYGLGVGALIVGLRWWPVAALSPCWAVLIMNTLVPVIDRLDRRWRRGLMQ